MADIIDDRIARRNVAALAAANAILGAQMSMIFIVGGLVGQSLAWNACLATLPITFIVFGSMLTATPMSALMQRYGRRAGFFAGAAGGAAGAVISATALYTSSFGLMLVGSLLTGVYMSAHGFYRFAGTDRASEAFRPKAISCILSGGLLSAILGPQLVKATDDAFVIPFLGTYVAVIVLNVVGSALFFLIDIPKPEPARDAAGAGRSRREMLRNPVIVVAIICALVAYALMNLVMTSAPLAVVGCGYTTSNAADVVSGHVLAMYVPSFFTGHLIARFGVKPIMTAGLFILAGAGSVALAGTDLANFFVALILLGIGWNFAFIGATTLLANSHSVAERGRIQGLNDLIVFGGVTFASASSGGLMNCSGGSPVEGWTAVNLAMGPFLVLAGGALIWLAFRREPASRPAE
jgi:MFS family permease